MIHPDMSATYKGKTQNYSLLIRFKFSNIQDVQEAQKHIEQMNHKGLIINNKQRKHLEAYDTDKKIRLKTILERIPQDEEIRIGSLYKRVSLKGYPASYKTFQRDITILTLTNKINTRLQQAGGRTTLIRKVDNYI